MKTFNWLVVCFSPSLTLYCNRYIPGTSKVAVGSQVNIVPGELVEPAYVNASPLVAWPDHTTPLLAAGKDATDQFQRSLSGSFGSGLVGSAGRGFPSSLTVAVNWMLTGASLS